MDSGTIRLEETNLNRANERMFRMILTLVLALMVIAGIFLLLYSAVALVQKRSFFGSAPPDIRAVIQDKPERFRGQHLLGWVLLVFSMAVIAAAFVIGVWDGVKKGFGFWKYFARLLAVLYLYKIWDMTFLDRFLLTKTRFFQRYYPEADGCESFEKVGFNRKSQMTKLIVFPFVLAAVAGILVLIFR